MDGSQVAVFWGQSTEDLSDVCSSGDYNVVILSFLTSLSPPKLNLGKDTGTPSAEQAKKSGWGLFDGTVAPSGGSSVASQITACQTKGIKVMISFGGTSTASNAVFSSDDDAKTAAGYVWDLFLGGTGSASLRPFGSVILDGLDVDNETGSGTHYDTFLSTLSASIKSDSSHTYYLSAAPEAHTVDAGDDTSIPESTMKYFDWLNIQFYNDATNEIGASGFNSSITKWNTLLSGISPSPKLVVGVPGGTGAADASSSKPAMQTADQIKDTVAGIKSLKLSNFGGVAIWDAGYAAKNTGFSAAVKSALA
ncbi:glycoside hydrolase superfamily [Coniella lustricola]|uniref:chitinase n=1 Tax=Coniella lustricola TaxID=2025994 RepID=A0A2T3AAG2_9PEZI|nr:glycoside hydrolase superfamily [Coniella lustricola]